jgi:shikimate kinase
VNTQNIVLVGFMGTGKSATGKVLAKRLGREFLDMDTLIEKREGKSIAAIFAEDGEPHFRKLERALVQELAGCSGLVIAPGGGIVLNPDNIADFGRSGLVVCLKATPETILKRVGNDTNRPLLQGGDKLQKIKDLLGKRKALYDAVPHGIDTDGQTPEQTADAVLALFDVASA